MTLATCARGRASDVTCLRQSSKESDSKCHARLEARREEVLAWARNTWQLLYCKPMVSLVSAKVEPPSSESLDTPSSESLDTAC